MAKFSSSAHWRDSARHPRFFMIDARAALPLVAFLLHIRLWTFIIALVVILFFALLERFGFTMSIFTRWFRSFLAGKYISADPWWKE